MNGQEPWSGAGRTSAPTAPAPAPAALSRPAAARWSGITFAIAFQLACAAAAASTISRTGAAMPAGSLLVKPGHHDEARQRAVGPSQGAGDRSFLVEILGAEERYRPVVGGFDIEPDGTSSEGLVSVRRGSAQ